MQLLQCLFHGTIQSSTGRIDMASPVEMPLSELMYRETSFGTEGKTDHALTLGHQHRHLDFLHRQRIVHDSLGIAHLEMK